jgi:transcriptional regulator
MYLPAAFLEDRLETLHALIRAHPLGTLITAGAGGLLANLIPFILIDSGDKGILRAHVARANAQVEALRSGAETLVVFQGPEAYISPSWYAAKAEHGRVVPTWNYVVVQARGTPRLVDDAAWIRAQIDELTASQENRRAEPWKVSDAPEPFIAGQLGAIVGVEIAVASLEGKWKVSQNRSAADREGVVEGLKREGSGGEMASLIAERAPKPE